MLLDRHFGFVAFDFFSKKKIRLICVCVIFVTNFLSFCLYLCHGQYFRCRGPFRTKTANVFEY